MTIHCWELNKAIQILETNEDADNSHWVRDVMHFIAQAEHKFFITLNIPNEIRKQLEKRP